MFRVGILTISDKGHAGERQDTAGPELGKLLDPARFEVAAYQVVPDEHEAIVSALVAWSDQDKLDLILTTGGTGLTPRDRTPEATLAAAERLVPGIPEAMRAYGLTKTPHAMLSRGVAVTRGATLIINLPGSPKGAKEGLEAIIPALPHALEKPHQGKHFEPFDRHHFRWNPYGFGLVGQIKFLETGHHHAGHADKHLGFVDVQRK